MYSLTLPASRLRPHYDSASHLEDGSLEALDGMPEALYSRPGPSPAPSPQQGEHVLSQEEVVCGVEVALGFQAAPDLGGREHTLNVRRQLVD